MNKRVVFLSVIIILLVPVFIFLVMNLSQLINRPNPEMHLDNATLANPASVNCKKVGGTTQIMNGPVGQYGLCNFEDDQACEEWALFRGECPVGGVKTTGFDTIEQKYCAWIGGQTLAVADAKCSLPGGKICSDKALYEGTCSQN